jgi:regulatory protein
MRRKSSPPDPGSEQAAREKCLRLLSIRARSAAELRDRLRAAGFADETTESVLSELAESGLVDDEDFARGWVAARQAAGAGRTKLNWELRRKGVSEELIRRVLDQEVDEQKELGSALRLAQQRLRRQPPDSRALARLRRLLLGRGFGFETVEQVMRRVAGEVEL